MKTLKCITMSHVKDRGQWFPPGSEMEMEEGEARELASRGYLDILGEVPPATDLTDGEPPPEKPKCGVKR
jgi:hypothetical protein